jgi:hypothetical protein
MRMFGMTHPDQVDELPADFVLWALEFDRVEGEARAEVQAEASRSAGGGRRG